MQRRVLVVDNAVHPRLFHPSRPWRRLLGDTPAETLHLPSCRSLPDLGGFTHVILAGSEASILRARPWFDLESRLVCDAVSRGVPVLGSCFGHEMLVYALSGPEHLARSVPPEIGWTKVEMIVDDPLFRGLPNPWSTFVHHYEQAVDPPPPWRCLGRTAACDTHVLRFGDHPVWGIQAHPEISPPRARRILWTTLPLMPERARLRAALRRPPPRNDVAVTVLRGFLTQGGVEPPDRQTPLTDEAAPLQTEGGPVRPEM